MAGIFAGRRPNKLLLSATRTRPALRQSRPSNSGVSWVLAGSRRCGSPMSGEHSIVAQISDRARGSLNGDDQSLLSSSRTRSL